jgi:hypothetical protein
MRYLTLGALVCLCVGIGSSGSVVQAQTTDPQVMAPITRFMEAFNKGDMAGAAATHASGEDLVILDEVAPFLWRGAKAFQTWAAALDADSKKHGMTEQKVTLGTATRIETADDGAYVVVPAVYTFKEKGVAMRERAQMTFALKKGASGWLIHGWTWTGPKPQKASGPATK